MRSINYKPIQAQGSRVAASRTHTHTIMLSTSRDTHTIMNRERTDVEI